MDAATTTKGLQLAAAVNIFGMSLFTVGLTQPGIPHLYPEVFSKFGIIMIMVWGLAYLAMAKRFTQAPEIIAVFALEKGLYVVTWVLWLATHIGSVGDIFEADPLTGIFFGAYGLIDLSFMVFFAAVWAQHRNAPSPS